MMKNLFLLTLFLFVACSHSEESKDGISKKQVTSALHKHRREFKLCYDSWIKNKSPETDIVEYVWQISPDGHVTWAKVKSSEMHNARNFNFCITALIKRIKFPKSKNGSFTVIALPIDFYKL